MNKVPHLEINFLPSQLNTSKPTGVASQLASLSSESNKPSFDGVTIEGMRNNPLYQHMDDIDKVGVAQKAIVDAASKVKSKQKYIRALNDLAQRPRKPKQ